VADDTPTTPRTTRGTRLAAIAMALLLITGSAKAATVAMTPEGGTYTIPVEINGAVRLPFMLDTGATNVVIPADVFLTLVRSGTISRRDYIGEGTSILADGSKRRLELYILREVRIGGFTIKNVEASITEKGSLLLGQSFLSKLPPWSIDYKQHALIIADRPTQQAVTPPKTDDGFLCRHCDDPAWAKRQEQRAYADGVAARREWEALMNVLPGHVGTTPPYYRMGAEYWARERANPRALCERPNNPLFTSGCEMAQQWFAQRSIGTNDPAHTRGWIAGH
jgi:clan AA aspartic protease (TIGR02281 family)